MPRRPRRAQWTDAACYHVMNRGQNRATIFNDDQDRAYFLKLVARYQQRYAVRLYHIASWIITFTCQGRSACGGRLGDWRARISADFVSATVSSTASRQRPACA